MKKWIAGLLTAALLFGVVPAAMAATETKSAVNFQVGYGEVNVTPALIKTGATQTVDGKAFDEYHFAKRDGTSSGQPLHLAGNFDTSTRWATTPASDASGTLWMKAIALADGENTKIVMTTDFIRVPIGWNVIVEDIVLDEGDPSKWDSKFAYLWTTRTDTVKNGKVESTTTVVDETLKAKWKDELLPRYTGLASVYGLEREEGTSLISMSGTHTHSSVDIGDANNSKNVSQEAKWHTSNLNKVLGDGGKVDDNSAKETTYFHEYWLPGALEAVSLALADLNPAEIQVNSVQVNSDTTNYAYREDNLGRKAMSWVRHFLYSDGTVATVNSGHTGGKGIAQLRPGDQEMQLIRFARANAEDIVLVNFQVHPTDAMGGANTTQRRTISADYCGILCDYLNQNVKDCKAAYFQGAAGNVNRDGGGSGVITTPTNSSADPTTISSYSNFGTTMGKIAAAALNDMTTLPAGRVQSLRNETTVVEQGYEQYRSIQQDVITVGNAFAFVTAGYEMFDSNAMDLKKATKASFTDIRDGATTTNDGGYGVVFVIENSQGHEYMPNWQTNHYTLLGGPQAYETWVSCFNEVPGTAEDLTDGLIYMLKTLNPNLAK